MDSHADRLLTQRQEGTWLFLVLCWALFLLGNMGPPLSQEITHFNPFYSQAEQPGQCKAFGVLWELQRRPCTLLPAAWRAWRKQMALHASTGVVNPCWTGLATWNDTLFPEPEMDLQCFLHSSCPWHSWTCGAGASLRYPPGSQLNWGSDLKTDDAGATCTPQICSFWAFRAIAVLPAN